MGDLAGSGLVVAGHPLLGAGVRVAGERDERLFMGRLSLATHGWVGDHEVFDTVLLPGTAFVELVLAAGREVGCNVLEDLTLEAPLVLGDASVQLQVSVAEAGEGEQRAVAVYSRVEDAFAGDEGEAGWVRHATGLLGCEPEGSVESGVLELQELAWPPVGAEPLDIEYLYDRLAEAGFGYGPVFRGVRAAWRDEGAVYAEVALSDQDAQDAQDADRFGIHPALFDAVFHAVIDMLRETFGHDKLPVPFSWSGVRLYQHGARTLRVCLGWDGESALTIAAVNENGVPVLAVNSLQARPIDIGALAAMRRPEKDALFAVHWQPVSPEAFQPTSPTRAMPADQRRARHARQARAQDTGSTEQGVVLLGGLELEGIEPQARYEGVAELLGALVEGAQAPGVVFAALPGSGGEAGGEAGGAGVAGATHAGVLEALELLQAWLAAQELGDTRLVFVGSGAVAVDGAEDPDLAAAAVWGLVRSAQSEHPDRFLLVDHLDAAGFPWMGVLAGGEPQLAVRGEKVFVPRLVRVGALAGEPEAGDGAAGDGGSGDGCGVFVG